MQEREVHLSHVQKSSYNRTGASGDLVPRPEMLMCSLLQYHSSIFVRYPCDSTCYVVLLHAETIMLDISICA
ncbi:hypothetical protein OESDEN_09457 [Oesophagostomum dentatum]|uniref:Uncharacterized protein n=1 Tax=Oesophagostomum dentatum TaxID=61180 RepID=A0A0B1T4J3_OESDE|nr:hypothetical protein OESDEN_09457 [Oesophagostomum dentatum]